MSRRLRRAAVGRAKRSRGRSPRGRLHCAVRRRRRARSAEPEPLRNIARSVKRDASATSVSLNGCFQPLGGCGVTTSARKLTEGAWDRRFVRARSAAGCKRVISAASLTLPATPLTIPHFTRWPLDLPSNSLPASTPYRVVLRNLMLGCLLLKEIQTRFTQCYRHLDRFFSES